MKRKLTVYIVLTALLLTAVTAFGCKQGKTDGTAASSGDTQTSAGTASEENAASDETTAASADGVKISMREYRVSFDTTYGQYADYIKNLSLTDEQLREYQEAAARQILLQKIYIKEGKALGITLTEEELESCRKAAKESMDGIEAQYAEYLIQNDVYSDAALEEQIAEYYRNFGMDEDAYADLLEEMNEAALYVQKITDYYAEEDTPDEETLLQYYRDTVEAEMFEENADGTKTLKYVPGQFWDYLKKYRDGQYSPMLYLPEGFIYIDYVVLHAETQEEAEEFVRQFAEGECSFDELLTSGDNMDPYRETLTGPYPIAEYDHAQLFTPQELYNKAAALEIGQTDCFIAQPVTDEDGNTTVAVYLVRRAEGTMCMEGESGVIDINCFPSIRDAAVYNYRQYRMAARQEQWLSDVAYADAIYAYKGPLG